MISDTLAQFAGHWYLSLETYRQNGEPVRTPMWFVEKEGVLYVRTPARTAKVKRLRHNPEVRVAPCTFWGNVQGEWVPGEARTIPAGQAGWVNGLSRRKYGLLKWGVDARNWLLQIPFVVIVIHV
ncbi:MAG: PPOX class F420-dependent oxidoreductase [Anaerolineales bacterium]